MFLFLNPKTLNISHAFRTVFLHCFIRLQNSQIHLKQSAAPRVNSFYKSGLSKQNPGYVIRL